ncbi:MAG: TonB-dependent receptor [Acidobacteriia bacterium]|nr:TonB-dependent receptor [Terriglobia bacterium]
MRANQYPLRWFSSLCCIALACVCFLLTATQPGLAQVDQGAVTGLVTDSSGAVVGNAEVTLTNQDNGLVLQTATSSSGEFTFSPVRIGNYSISATAAGFATTSQKDLKLSVQQRLLVNLQLKPGSTSERVEVSATAPLMQTEDASVGQVVDSHTINNMALNGRNFTFLAQLAAGVNSPQADTRGNAATGAFAANGNRPAQNNYMLDGIDNNSDTVDFLNGTNYVVLPPLEAIQEFKVQTSGFSAEFGRSGAAVLNATIKSGTNSFHGAAWEYFRNDKLDAADWFENFHNVPKGELRQNQFGVSGGGPIIKNKIFIFGDYEGLRRLQGTILSGSVPTVLERNGINGLGADPTLADFSDLITGQTGTETDALGRTIPLGTILDPATTRPVTLGVADPISGRVATSTGFARDPINTNCPASTAAYTLAGCTLNQMPLNRLDPNAIKLLNLYPLPTSGSLFSNYGVSPKLDEHRNSFDTRLDLNFSEKNQLFYRFSYVDDPQFIPGIFGGIADGGGFQQGNQTALAQQSALAYTHVFSPTMVNVARAGLNYLHTTRVSPSANDLSDIPGQFGIQGIPQLHENGGLPAFGINGLSTLGSNAFLPSDEVTSTFQVTDDFTKIYGKHTFKMGFEWQHVKFSTLQPPWSRGEFDYGSVYTDVPNVRNGNTGRAQFLLSPTATTVAGGIDNVGGSSEGPGSNSMFVSNISLTDNGKNYYGSYINDDWKVTPKLTVNLGLRWDFFGLVFEHHGAQANFVPSGPPSNTPLYLLPAGANPASFSTSFNTLLAQDGIGLVIGDKYGKGLGRSQKYNFAPRVGFAYQVTPKLVARGGFGLFYNGFENRGFSPNLGENYPFQFNFQFAAPDDGHSISFPGCATAATFEIGFTCTPLDPTLVNASGLGLRGIQFDYLTPYTMSGNLTLQYQVTPTFTLQAGYVTSLARHLEVFPNSNLPTRILPVDASLTGTPPSQGGLPFPDFGQGGSYATTNGNSHYHSLQTKAEKQFANGLSFLATYTWSQARTDAGDLLNGGSTAAFRAPDVPGAGIAYDYGLASFDIRNVVHLSGSYELPFGHGKPYMANAGTAANALLGGWSVSWGAVLQGGQPITLSCPSGTGNGTGCYDIVVSGQDVKRGMHIDSNGQPSFLGNPAAFTQPCVWRSTGPDTTSVPGCIPIDGGLGLLGGGPTQIAGPPFKRLDFSTFKDFKFGERFSLQFRAEFFNILNHPNFNAPNFGGNGVVAIGGSGNFTSSNFGEVGSTRDAPYDPRQIQFALKLRY